MKKTILFVIMCVLAFVDSNAQNATSAKSVLDKTAKVLGHKGGASAKFTVSNPKTGRVSGTIAIKENKFHARTGQATIWFNGKTQWTYMPQNEEVSITTPTMAQQQMMNPYAFINIYRNGCNLSMKSKGNRYEIHIVAQDKSKSIQEMYVTVSKTTYIPSTIKVKQGSTWSTITISDFLAKNQPDRMFSFREKDFPNAEIVDLR